MIRKPLDDSLAPIPKADLFQSPVDLSYLDLLPESVAENRCVLPLGSKEGALVVAMADPGDDAIVHEIEFTSGLDVRRVFVPFAELRPLVRIAYERKRLGDRQLAFDRPRRDAPARRKVLDGRAVADARKEPEGNVHERETARPRPATVVLLLESEGGDRDLLAETLADSGARVLTTDDGLLGLHLAATERPDVVLADVKLGGIHGLEVAHHLIHDPRFGSPQVILTGSAERTKDEVQTLKRSHGFLDYMSRPYDLGAVFRKVVQVTADRVRPDGDAPEVGPHHEELTRLLKNGANTHRDGDTGGAIAALSAAIKLDPLHYDARFNLALLQARTGKDEDAAAELGRCLVLRPDHFEARKTRGILLERLGRHAEAAVEYDAAIALTNDEALRRTLERRADTARATSPRR